MSLTFLGERIRSVNKAIFHNLPRETTRLLIISNIDTVDKMNINDLMSFNFVFLLVKKCADARERVLV